MSRKYHTLVAREDDGRWYPQFGDYSRACVVQEKRDSYCEYRSKDLKVIVSGDTKAEIDQAVASLNNGRS